MVLTSDSVVEPGQQAASATVPLLMAVMNVTPDSFSDGGDIGTPQDAARRAEVLLDAGADWLDIGGESTRPGAAPVPVDDEVARVVPVVRHILRAHPNAVVSVDTRRPEVASKAIDAGARVINDVSGLEDPRMRATCAAGEVTCVVMHKRGQPATMQRDTDYGDLVVEVRDYLGRQVSLARADGIRSDRIIVDPGLGFGKAMHDNPSLIRATPVFAELGFPVLIGASRKRFVGQLTGRSEPKERVNGSVGAALAAAALGARVLRVHDVAATREALAVFMPCLGATGEVGGHP